MSIKKIIAIVVIYFIGWIGWWTLGTATSTRSYESTYRLGSQVEALWGTALVQKAPRFSVTIPGTQNVRWLTPVETRINTEIEPDYKKKGLLWYSTYNCRFEGIYTVHNEEEIMQKIRLHFDFPAKGGTYDEFVMYINGSPINIPVDTFDGVDEIVELDSGQKMMFKIKYKTRGLNTWTYEPAIETGRVKNFSLRARTGFKNIDYGQGGLSPMTVEETESGMVLDWKASDLITKNNINIVVPERLNPGPLTTRITYFAPVCLLFFFVLIATSGIMNRIDIHPMHYLFVTAGFFAFHLLLSYMAGHFWIHFCFIVSAIISVSLVTSYLYTALGKSFPWKIAIAGQMFFLVLFSYSFFIKGITGLIIAIGSVVTLAFLMKVTAHLDWNDIFKVAVNKTQQTDHGKKAIEI